MKTIPIKCRGADLKAIDELTEFQGDIKDLTKQNYAKLRKSMVKHGFSAPIFVWEHEGDNYILDGHQRLRVLGKLREEGYDIPLLPVVYIEADDEKQAKEKLLLITSQYGDFNVQGLDEFIYEGQLDLSELTTEVRLLDVKELQLSTEIDEPLQDSEPLVDAAKELQAKWETSSGQLWLLGNHRLLCGDATAAEDVSRLLDGDVPLLMVTDPPYGVEYDPGWRNEAAKKGQLAYAASRIGEVDNDDRVDWSEAWELFPGDVVYTWSPPGDHVIHTGLALVKAGYEIRNQIIWRKPHFPISRGHYTYQHEPCWYAVKKGRTAHWIGKHNASTVWDISLDKNVAGGHSTQKPLECMAMPIRNHDSEFVYEPFSGTGTTIIACEGLGRKCLAIEVNPAYVAVALQRWHDVTGSSPTVGLTRKTGEKQDETRHV